MRPVLYTILFFVSFAGCMVSKSYGQADTSKSGLYESMSLKDLLNIKIVSASKKTELLFDAPLSASVLTGEEIRNSGCTSIMEALRLVPGMIVREQSNGNYDIHMRGMDNIPPNASFDIASSAMLAMIDNRPVYSYLRGGTFWETLPVDIHDVERIEVIRGPAAALYGPNAVNGVINIITRQIKTEGLYLVANSQLGSYHTVINTASIGYRKKKWALITSGNYQNRARTQRSYFEFSRNMLLEQPGYFLKISGDTAANVNQRYPRPGQAMEKYAGNVFLTYTAAENICVELSAGLQRSSVQKVSAENEITPLSTASSDSRYADIRARLDKLSAQISYNYGTQNVDHDPGNKYDFSTIDMNLEYNYTAGNFSLKPGLCYKSATYDDTKYSDIVHRAGILNSKGMITAQSASLRGEYKILNKKLRLVAGLATSKFNYPDASYLSSELAATYKVNKKHLFRVVHSRSPRSSNIFDTYVDQAISLYQTSFRNYTEIAIIGNKNLKLLTADMFEAGYRGIVSSRVSIDVELFDIRSKNHNIPVWSHPITEYEGVDTIHETPIVSTNLPLRLVQQGITVSVSYNSKKLTVKPFITVQQSRIKDYAPFINTVDAGNGPNNIYSAMGSEMINKSTPAVFGGGYINFMPEKRFNMNLSAYYFSGQYYSHLSNILFNDGIRGRDHINAKLLVNASISYEAVHMLRIFCSAKNILNNNSREFFHSDAVPFMLLAGLRFEFQKL